MARRNGGIVGKQNRTAIAKASGIWTISDSLESIKADNWPKLLFTGGNITSTDVYTLGNFMTTASNMATPASGGTLTINGVNLGNYDYVTKVGNQTISTFTNSEWFTTTEDTRSAWIAIKGNLTVNSGQTLIPTNRKLFTVIFVKGDLVVNGSISMTKRGANHSGTGNSGGSVTAGDILIKSGTYSSVVNPKIPATGGTGGSAVVGGGNGVVGTAGTAGGTGGGGSGGSYHEGGGSTSGAGAAGTAFTGGSGGGAVTNTSSYLTAGSAVANGGAGGAGAGNYYGAGGGAGNPGGSGYGSGATSGESGTGGVLIIICTGTISGSGTITAAGANGGGGSYNGKPDGGGTNAGASGGGSVTVMYTTDTSSITPSAAGGSAIVGSGAGAGLGGNGGAGTARKLQL